MKPASLFTLALSAIVALCVLRLLAPSGDAYSGERFANPHSDIPCTDCHTLRADIAGGSFQGLVFRKECTRCHNVETANNTGIPLSFHQANDKGCSECHTFHDVEKITAARKQFRVSYENSYQRGQCYSCHDPSSSLSDLSAAHRTAGDLYHSDFRILGKLSPSQACLICHSNTQASDGSAPAGSKDAPHFDEHGSHPVGVPVVPGTGKPGNRIRPELDPRIRLFSGRMECQTCHSLSARTNFRLVPFESKKALCEACHRVN